MRIGPVVNNQRHQLKVCGNCFSQIYASKENIKHSDDDDDDFDDGDDDDDVDKIVVCTVAGCRPGEELVASRK